MPLFTSTINAAMAGRVIGACPLAFFDFLGQPMRVWPGFGTLSLGGYEWSGTGDFGSVEGLGQGASDTAQSVTFTLAGVAPEMQSIAKNSETVVKGRAVIVYVQFFDVTGNNPFLPLDNMFAIWSGVMDTMSFKANGPATRTITLTCEGENADRRRPVFGLLTDADQQARYPGDTALKLRASMKTKYLRTPW